MHVKRLHACITSVSRKEEKGEKWEKREKGEEVKVCKNLAELSLNYLPLNAVVIFPNAQFDLFLKTQQMCAQEMCMYVHCTCT